MTNQFWFKPKNYGYGATPTTWQGWAVVAVYSVVIVACVLAMMAHKGSLLMFVSGMIVAVVSTVVLTVVCVKRTDGAWGWNWGAKQIVGKK